MEMVQLHPPTIGFCCVVAFVVIVFGIIPATYIKGLLDGWEWCATGARKEIEKLQARLDAKENKPHA